MKRIIFLFFIIVSLSIAQPKQSGINYNSTYTALDSAGTWTGTKEYLSKDYSWVCVTVSSDQSGTGKIAFSRDGTTFNSYYFFSYTAGDTTNNKFYAPVTMDWVRISYSNDTVAQTSFSLTTSYLIASPIPLVDNGALKTFITASSNIKTLVDTSSAALDSLAFGFTSRHIGINNDESGGIEDSTTLWISKTSSFTPGETFPIYAAESLPLDWAVSKIYFKWSVQATPKANKKSRFIVN